MVGENSNKMKLAKILWDDSEAHNQMWISEEEIKEWAEKRSFAESIGWILMITKNYMVIVSDTDVSHGGDSYGRAFKIPRKMIQEITYL